jgi:hypothetical protein
LSVTLSEIQVAFRGEVAGAAELTWSQVSIWRQARRTGRTMNLVVVMPVPEDTTVQEMTAVLRFMIGRHPALRTRMRFSGEQPDEAYPQQVVSASGELPLQILDIDDGDDPDLVAERLRSRYELTWFDYEHEFPVRLGMVRQAGVMVRMVAGYSHMAADGAGLEALGRDLVTRFDRSALAATAPPRVLDPLELARSQGGPAGQRQTAKSLRYWAAQLGRLPDWRAQEPAEPPEPRYAELVAYSPAMELCLRAIAARTKVASNYVLIAAYAVAVARVMDRNPSAVQLVVSNRFRPGFEDTVAQVSQDAICVVDAADATFDEVVGRAWSTATNSSLNAYYDPRECDRLLAETERRLGRPLDVAWHLNDRRAMAGPLEIESPLPEAQLKAALDDALSHTRIFWDRRCPSFEGTLFIQVDSAPDATAPDRAELDEGLPAVYLAIWTDMHHFAADRVEAFVRAMEAVLVEAAFDAKVPTGVQRPAVAA